MKMVSLSIISLIVIALIGVSWAYASPTRPLAVISLKIGKTIFRVEVADTYIARGKGLSGHAPLGIKHGMLFVFPSPSSGAFWMQGMLFPLDFVWIKNGLVMGVTENALPMSQTGYKLYYPPVPVDRVLEISAGAVKKFGVKIGDRVY